MATTKQKRIGPVMARVARIVAALPGQTLMDVAYQVAPRGRPGGTAGLGYGYAACWRAVCAGLIVAVEREDKKGCYRLVPPTL